MNLEKLRDLDEILVECPSCKGPLRPTQVQIAGMPIVVSARCSGCGRTFDFDWPAGHALLHPVIVESETGAVHVGGSEWYARRVLRCLATRSDPIPVEITVRGSCRVGGTATVLDCIDYLYGHVLLKVMSAAKHMREAPGDDTVVVVPKLLSWLVPEGAVIVEVDMPLSLGEHGLAGLDAVIEEVLEPCSAVRISPAISQPEMTAEELEMLDLRPKRDGEIPLQIGFILRSDRLWLGPDSLPLRATRRLPRRLREGRLLRRQHRNYGRLARRVRQQHPEARIVALGIGQPGGLPAEIRDLRTPGPIREESAWLAEYARCRVVVGVHGSALLLPSLLAETVVDLVPTYKLARTFLTDLIIPAGSIEHPKLSLFRFRMLPVESTPETVAANVLSIINTAEFQHKNLIENAHAYNSVGWPQPFHWRRTELRPGSEREPLRQSSSAN